MAATVEAGADWVGFVFADGSPRAIDPAMAAALADPFTIRRVGLFVDPSDGALDAVLAGVRLDILQLHTSRARAIAIRRRTGLPVWHAVAVATASDLPGDGDGIDALLLDAPSTAGGLPGGNARSFDWRVLQGWRAPCPWLLAGGLTPGNVAQAVALSGATAVDVSSGVEISRGVKSPELIRAFVKAARTAADGPHGTARPAEG